MRRAEAILTGQASYASGHETCCGCYDAIFSFLNPPDKRGSRIAGKGWTSGVRVKEIPPASSEGEGLVWAPTQAHWTGSDELASIHLVCLLCQALPSCHPLLPHSQGPKSRHDKSGGVGGRGRTQEQGLCKSQDPGQEGGARAPPLASQPSFLPPELQSCPLATVCPPYPTHHPVIISLQTWGQALEIVPACGWMRNPFPTGGSALLVTVV